MRAERTRGVLAIAATYLLFLLCAQFGFLEQARGELAPAAVQGVMAAMGLAGLAASLATGRLLAHTDARRLTRRALLATAAAAAISPVAHGTAALTLAAVALGATLGVLTVAIAADLPALLPGPRRGLATGAGTGLAYLAANLPPLFAGSPAVRALVPAAVASLAALLLPRRASTAGSPQERPAATDGPRFPALVVAFAALVALDACAFAVIQLQPALAAPTWGSDARRLLQGSTHLVAALGAGLALDAGALGGVLFGSWALFALAFGLLLGGGPLLGIAGPLYAAGISAYSTALVTAPSRAPDERLPARWRAALLYGLAGWLGSAAGVGAAQDLGTIPGSLVAVAGLAMLGLAWRSPRAAFSRLRQVAAPALLLALAALGVGWAWRSAPVGTASPAPADEDGSSGFSESAERGRAVYIAEGCIHCHSQYVRPAPTRDAAWWGPARPLDRATTPVLVGNRRQGPDLAEIGNRRSAVWNREHLRDPRLLDPASRMPAYAHLFAPGERRGEDLVAYLASLGEGTLRERDALTAGEPLPAPHVPASAARGRALFATWCATCHGAGGRGDGPLAKELPAALMDLTRPNFRLVREGPGAPPLDASLARLVRHGLPPTTMPGHEYLTDQEVVDLVAWVRTLHGERGPMRAPADRETRTAHLWHRLFGGWAAAAVRRPRTTIALALLVAAAALALSASHLTLKTSNLDLVDPELPPVADFRAFAERFGTPNMLVVVLEGSDEATLHDAVDRVVEHVRRAPGVRSVVGRLPYEPGDLALLGVDPYFAARDRRAFYVFVQPADASSSAQTIGPFAAAVRRAIADSGAAALGVRIGTTGLPQYALDDRTVIQHDISRLSGLSFVVVLAVFVLGFAEFMRPVLAMAGLTVAAAAMLGVAALAPGHLTLLSAFFISALFGLGSDYGIFVIDAFEERLAAGEEKVAALVGAVRFLAPGLATETFATAAAFLTLAFSGFRGFAELGWIAAVGLLLSLVAMIVLLPALLVLHRGGGRRREKPLAARRLGRLLLALQHPALAAGLAVAALAGLAVGLPAFDGDYLALQPRDSEAVRLERAMVSGSDFSPVAAAFTVDSPEAAAALAERLRGEAEVGGVRSLADLAPLDAFATPLAEERAAFGRSFASADGHYAVYAYPAGDIWDPAVESSFLARMRAVDPRVTGMPVLGRFMIDLSRRALVRTGLLATAVVLLLVISEIGFSRWALVAVTPTLLGVAAMLGTMRLLGIAWNPINVMALPVVIGTAVDAGIHVTHRFLVDRGDLVAAVAGSGRAVLLSSLTTLAGFGALVFTSHRGLASFATVLVVGVLAGLVLSLFLLPQLLRLAWRLERGESAERSLAG